MDEWMIIGVWQQLQHSNSITRELGVRHQQRVWNLDQQSQRRMDAKMATDVADN